MNTTGTACEPPAPSAPDVVVKPTQLGRAQLTVPCTNPASMLRPGAVWKLSGSFHGAYSFGTAPTGVASLVYHAHSGLAAVCAPVPLMLGETVIQ